MAKRHKGGVKSRQTDGKKRGRMESRYAELHALHTGRQRYAINVDYVGERYIKGEPTPTFVVEITGLDEVDGKPKTHHLTKIEERYTGTMPSNVYFRIARDYKIPFYIVVPNNTCTYFCVTKVTDPNFQVGSLDWDIQRSDRHWNWVEIIDLSKAERAERKRLISEIKTNGFKRSMKKRAFTLRVDGYLKRKRPEIWDKYFA